MAAPAAVQELVERFNAHRETCQSAQYNEAQLRAAFLARLESWRLDLARNFALRNLDLSQRDLNFAVQRTIDRMVFLRICEDRGIEPYGTLQSLKTPRNIYRRLGELFHRADDRYNSGLFHFSPEKDRAEPPDELTLALADRRQAAEGNPRKALFPRKPLRVLGPADRDSRPGVRAVPGQGHSADGGASGEGRGEARGPQGRRRLLHAGVHRRLHRRSRRSATAGGEGKGKGEREMLRRKRTMNATSADADANDSNIIIAVGRSRPSRQAPHSRSGLRLRLVLDRRLQISSGLAPRTGMSRTGRRSTPRAAIRSSIAARPAIGG